MILEVLGSLLCVHRQDLWSAPCLSVSFLLNEFIPLYVPCGSYEAFVRGDLKLCCTIW